MSILAFLTFSLPVLTGMSVVHFLWVDKNNPFDWILKLSLGIGMGLGVSSLAYFAYLTILAGSPYFLYVELLFLLAALINAYLKHRNTAHIPSPRLKLNPPQIAILLVAALAAVSTFLGVASYGYQRIRGDWDTWMIFNRSARFIYRAPQTWQDAFSPQMNLVFHADYPPLVALNIAAHWDVLDEETAFVPMFQGLLFSFATLGLCFGALAGLKSPGQAGLGLILLAGVHFLREGGRQTADIPQAFYMLAFVAFLLFYYREERTILMAFAGFMAGLAAWTKNEGLFFLPGSAVVIAFIALWRRSFRDVLFYLAGVSLPLTAVLYFKFQIAPSSEFLSAGWSTIIQRLTDMSRHQFIFGAFKNYFLHGGGWYGIGIFLILGVYFLVFYSRNGEISTAALASLAILVLQIMGYYLVYLISPYDLKWHISFSLGRLFAQVYPAAVLAVLAATRTPEMAFSSQSKWNR